MVKRLDVLWVGCVERSALSHELRECSGTG